LLPELAIGHGWFSADESLRDETWKAMSWELYLDGKVVDLQAFGAIDADLPQTGLDKQDPDKEVITKLRTWDVTLSNLAVGAHSLRSILHVSQPIDDGFHITQPGTYELVSRFTVYSPPTPTLEVTKVIATQPEDIAGIWTTRYNPVGGPAYIQYKADGTWAIAKTVEKLKAPAQKGTFRFEGDRFITWDNECGEGEYTVQVLLFEGKPVGLAFSRLADACRDRVRDLTKPMSWVEP
jgi:hypothetical protein